MELSKRIIELLTKSNPMTPSEIAEALNIDKKELDKLLKQLKNDSKRSGTTYFESF